jgi:hypothetical protein
MGEVAGADDRDALLLRSPPEPLGAHVLACCAGVLGMDVEVGKERHGQDYNTERCLLSAKEKDALTPGGRPNARHNEPVPRIPQELLRLLNAIEMKRAAATRSDRWRLSEGPLVLVVYEARCANAAQRRPVAAVPRRIGCERGHIRSAGPRAGQIIIRRVRDAIGQRECEHGGICCCPYLDVIHGSIVCRVRLQHPIDARCAVPIDAVNDQRLIYGLARFTAVDTAEVIGFGDGIRTLQGSVVLEVAGVRCLGHKYLQSRRNHRRRIAHRIETSASRHEQGSDRKNKQDAHLPFLLL